LPCPVADCRRFTFVGCVPVAFPVARCYVVARSTFPVVIRLRLILRFRVCSRCFTLYCAALLVAALFGLRLIYGLDFDCVDCYFAAFDLFTFVIAAPTFSRFR